MFRKSVIGFLSATLAILPLSLAVAAEGSGVDVGGESNSKIVTSSESELDSLGDFEANIVGAAEADVVGGSGGTFAFPINVTVYGLPYVRIPSAPFDATDWDEYCFIVRYSTVEVGGAQEAQTGADNRYAFEQEKTYYNGAEADWVQDHKAWEDAVEAIDAENEQREEDGESLLGYPPEPQRPKFPLEVCEGEPAAIPDFVPAFDAAAELIRSIDRPDLEMKPGSGITGLAAYLETKRPLSLTEAERTMPDLGRDISDPSNPTPIGGTVSFEGQGEFTVDWGDGSPLEGPFEEPGAAFGQEGLAITHAYADRGDHTVTVTDSWRVSMRVDFLGEEFIFTHREAFEPAVLGFPVVEVRSVRER